MTPDATLGTWLVSLLADPDAMVRGEAIAALGHPWHAAGIAPLARTAATDADAPATAAVRALAAIGTPAAYDALTELSRGERTLVAATARAFLKQMPTPAR
jgi:HEAT repeat protein